VDRRPPLILIVDDEPLNARIVESMLRRHGFATLTAQSGPEAREIAALQPVDLILLDVMMPGETGYQTCQLLKDNPATADIPIIFISALTDTASRVHGLECGGVDFISKPFEKAEVLARVKVHLRLRLTYRALIETQTERLGQIQAAQQSLLVRPEELPEARFAVHFAPVLEAGGDIYDVLPTGLGIHDYIVADVSGHDLGAGFLTSALTALLRQNVNAASSPEESLTMTNHVLTRLLTDGAHATLAMVRLNRGQGLLHLVSAGHPPALLARTNGTIERLDAEGDILGVFDSAVFTPLETPVTSGDRIFLYTDGLIEGFGTPPLTRDQGIAMLWAAIRAHARCPMAEAVVGIHEFITSRKGPAEDDSLLLGIEV
jgi:sigma-B regulation protein RsbU (phosphoserine phosphatase)